MSFVLVYGDRFSGGGELARSLAENLGYPLIEPAMVIERAAAWGGSQSKLARILFDPPGCFRLLLRRTYNQILLLQAALAKEIGNGDAVCYGELADLLLHEDLPVIRVGIVASPESRIGTVRRLFGYHELEATAFLKNADRSRKKLLRLFCRQRRGDPAPHLLINLDRIDFSAATDTVVALVRRHAGKGCPISQEVLLVNFAVSTRVRAALAADPATAHLELSVEADQGQVAIRGPIREAHDLVEVRRVAERVPGVSDITLNGEEQPSSGAADRLAIRWQLGWRGLRPAFLATGLGLLAGFLFYILTYAIGSFVGQGFFPRWMQASQVVQGLVTDSRCGARHPNSDSAQCVRNCVARGDGVKYVLDDGKSLYELSDQHDADKYAGRQVRVRGVLNRKLGYIRVEAIEPL